MQPTDSRRFDQQESQLPPGEGVDMVAIYRTVLRALVYLEGKDYTEHRQADVRKHDDLPNPASAKDTPQG